MSDRFPGQIWIGGTLSRSKPLHDDQDDFLTVRRGLIEALSSDGASHEYGDCVIEANCTEEEFLEYLRPFEPGGGVLRFRNAEAVNGEFSETEAFCIEYGIPFDRNSDHYCEYDGETVYWRPGMGRPTVVYADSSGNERVDGATVRKAMELLDKFEQVAGKVTVFQTRDWERLVIGIGLLHDVCPELPSNLEPFKIVA